MRRSEASRGGGAVKRVAGRCKANGKPVLNTFREQRFERHPLAVMSKEATEATVISLDIAGEQCPMRFFPQGKNEAEW